MIAYYTSLKLYSTKEIMCLYIQFMFDQLVVPPFPLHQAINQEEEEEEEVDSMRQPLLYPS